jgi:hypothetical protein
MTSTIASAPQLHDHAWHRTSPPNSQYSVGVDEYRCTVCDVTWSLWSHRRVTAEPVADETCDPVVRRGIGSPGLPTMLRISAGARPVLPNQ